MNTYKPGYIRRIKGHAELERNAGHAAAEPESRIHKFALETGLTLIPGGRRALWVALQDGKPTVWVEVGREDAHHGLEIIGIATGRNAPSPTEVRYVGTIVGIEGYLVWHFYCRGEV